MTIQRLGKVVSLTLLCTSFAFTTHSPANYIPHHAPATTTSVHRVDSVWTRVDATVYYPTGQPTYSGEIIPRHYHRRTARVRFIAVSHDLLRRYGLQDTLLVKGDLRDPYWDKSLNGVYVIKDLMNRRFKHRVDILSRPHHERDIGLWKARVLSYSELRHARRNAQNKRPSRVRHAGYQRLRPGSTAGSSKQHARRNS